MLEDVFRKGVVLVAFIALAILLLIGGANAKIITVDDGGGANYTRIQDAINAASDGDTILVYGGTYSENVEIYKSLTLRGIDNGGGKPVVDAQSIGSAITLSAYGITLEGFNAINATGDGEESGIKINSNNNTLINNDANSNEWYGIYLKSSSNNTLINNNANKNGWAGIYLESANNNTLINNNANKNGWGGIELHSSSKNMLNGNYVKNNSYGFYLITTSNNVIKSNNALNNDNYGIYMMFSRSDTLINNSMTGNQYNFGLDGGWDMDFDNNIDASNQVDGKAIYYIKGAANTVYDSNAGTFYCIKCINITIKNIKLNKNGAGIFFWKTINSRIQNVSVSKNENGIHLESSSNNNIISDSNVFNNNYGIYLESSISNTLINNNANSNNNYGIFLLYSSDNNIISGNNVSNNDDGIYLHSSNNNNLSSNNVKLNNEYGIYLRYNSNNNTIFNNYFNNTNNVWNDGNNYWNTTKTLGMNIVGGSFIGGNYWAYPKGKIISQTCSDTDNDGICDSTYVLGSGDIDHLPLTMPSPIPTSTPTPTPTLTPTPTSTPTPTTPTATVTPLPTSPPTPITTPTGVGYDTNDNGRIDRSEAVQAVIDYFSDIIIKQDAVTIVIAYFSGSSTQTPTPSPTFLPTPTPTITPIPTPTVTNAPALTPQIIINYTAIKTPSLLPRNCCSNLSGSNYTYLIITLTIENHGYAEFYTRHSDFNLIVNNVQYKPDSILNMLSNNVLFNVNILNNGKFTGSIVYEVPSDMGDFQIQYSGSYTDYNIIYFNGSSIPIPTPTVTNAPALTPQIIINYTAIKTPSLLPRNCCSNLSGSNYTYLIITLTIENHGYAEFYTRHSDFNLIVNNVQYKPDSILNMLSNNVLFNVNILNNGKFTGSIVYEVPSNVQEYKLLWDSSSSSTTYQIIYIPESYTI